MRRIHVFVACVCSIFLAVVTVASVAVQESAPQWKTVEEDWYTMELGGAHAGWSSRIVQTDGSRFKTDTNVKMKISRGSIAMEITMVSSFIETSDGKPVSMEFTQNMSKMVMESRWMFHADHVEQVTKQGGRETTTMVALPEGEWFTPHALDFYTKKQRDSGAQELTYRMVDPSNGIKPITVTSKRTGEGKHEQNGSTIDVTIWSSESDLMPGVPSIEKINPLGQMVFQETSAPGLGNIVTRLTTKEQATGQPAGAAPELMLKTFITPDKAIANPEKAVRSRLRLTVIEGTMNALPQAGAQRVEMSADGKSAVLAIDINDSLPAGADDAKNPDYVAASAMIDTSDELIQKLAKRATARSKGEEAASDDPQRRAEALRRFVRQHISKKGMATAFASASETAKMRTGDCSEHGVLLCALLRADGIPARVATGLVYVNEFEGKEGIFGWHMWTQALIDGKWVDFDATLGERYNAAHVLTSTSSLNDGAFGSDMAAIVQLIGNLKIEVLEVQYE